MSQDDYTILGHDVHCVAIAGGAAEYPAGRAFCPAAAYPEYPFARAGSLSDSNDAYAAVRESLRLLGLDSRHFGGEGWNPLGGFVQPGDTVVLKPNFVRDYRDTQAGDGNCLITHGAIVRAVADYVYIALRARGRIIVADAPQNDADFDAIARITGISSIQAFYQEHASVPLEVYDLRPARARKIDGVIIGHDALTGDPAGYVNVNLGPLSTFAPIENLCDRLYGAEYNRGELCSHHRDGRHEYMISRTILQADCLISLPKLKTHKKVGLTANLKNLVGINGDQNWLPHHREGTPGQGGDQFADNRLKRRVERRVLEQFKRFFPYLGAFRPVIAGPIKAAGRKVFGDTNQGTVRSGNWYGNDTTWRMVLDLNRILHYADADGRLHEWPVRRFFSVVDAIVAGEGNGPLDPTAKHSGVVVAGASPVAVDLVCARLMGFDYRKIPMLARSLGDHPLPLVPFDAKEVLALSNKQALRGWLEEWQGPLPGFRPHFGWQGHVELNVPRKQAGRIA